MANLTSEIFFFQAEDGIRDLVRSRGLGDVYKRQTLPSLLMPQPQKHLLNGETFLFRPNQKSHTKYELSLIHI